MTTFPDLPNVDLGPIKGGTRTYVLKEHLGHDLGVVPAGTTSDGASVPRLFWPAFPHDGATLPAALIHDDQYRRNPSAMTRKEVDRYFLKNMKACGLAWIHRHLIYRGVRVGAGFTWRKYRKADGR